MSADDRKPAETDEKSQSAFHRWMNRIAIVFCAVLFICAFGIQAAPRTMPAHIYQVPEGHDGMEPNLPGGSYLVVSNYAYSDPADIRRGGLLLYSRRKGGEIYDVVGRVVGLPGETVVTDGVFGDVPNIESNWTVLGGSEKGGMRVRESLGDSTHQILVSRMKRSGERRIELDSNELFVLPDNRYPEAIETHYGVVDFEEVVGSVWHLGWYTEGATPPPDAHSGDAKPIP